MINPVPKSLFKVDTPRGFFAGILEAGFTIFVILIAIRFFNAPNYCKAILAAGSSTGLILSPFLMGLWGKSRTPNSIKCGILMASCALFIFLASCTDQILFFSLSLLIAQICLSQVPSLMIGIYSEIYSKKERGYRFSLNLVLSTLGGMLSSYFLGRYLDLELADHRIALWTMAFAALFCSVLHFCMPKPPGVPVMVKRLDLLRNIFFIPFEDRLFFRILVAWMILGFGVIMTFPLRIEYLANPNGLNLKNEEIALIAVSNFLVFKVIGALICGKLFDRIHFMRFRIALNLVTLSAILVYFNSSSFLGLSIGTALAGFGTGGANIAWNLWVTKIAPTGKESDYMGVHMFLTGLRGSSAPFLGYLLVKPLGFTGISMVSTFFILTATIIFLTTIQNKRFQDSEIKKMEKTA